MITHYPPMRVLSRSPARAICTGIAVVLLALAARVPHARAQFQDTPLLEGGETTQKYILELSGTVLNETFNRVTMSLQLSGAPAGSLHPYLVIAKSFPDSLARNSFFWNSEHSTMEINTNTITCTIKPGSQTGQDIYFLYLSPKLLKQPNITHKAKEDKQRALKIAVPSVVPAQAGELRLTVNPNCISGTVWLQGYDKIEKSYVRYSATFSGTRAAHVDQITR